MKICGAQTKPVSGNVEANIKNHLLFIDKAISNGTDVIIFSELSLTGYEPALAKELATHATDPRFDVFRKKSNKSNIVIGVGIPTNDGENINISMIIFQPNKTPMIYSKKYLHPDEYPFFVSGINFPTLEVNGTSIGLAICYELSIPEHINVALKGGAEIYVASVAKFAKGVESAVKTLSDYSTQFSIPSLMINAAGPADNGICTGTSSIWNHKGVLMGQLGSSTEGLIIYDTSSGNVNEMMME
jgi:predicted amidohydrolase